jgi:hypothetical protein
MAVAPVTNLAGTQQNRPPVGARPAARPALLPQRLAGDATRFKPREAAAPGALPAEPAKFDGPEDFKAYVAAVVAAGQAARARAAQPAAALAAAEAALKAQDGEAGMDLALANTSVASLKAEAARVDAELAAQIDLAAKALDAARNPGRGRANRARRECDALQAQVATVRAAVGQAQDLLDQGTGTPAQRAAAYATIATQGHSSRAWRPSWWPSRPSLAPRPAAPPPKATPPSRPPRPAWPTWRPAARTPPRRPPPA